MFRVVVLLLLAAGSCVECEELTQPPSVTLQSGQNLTINCQVSYSVGGAFTTWVRHPAGKGLEWIGMAHAYRSYYKDSLKNQFSIDVDPSSKKVTLKGQNMQPGDTAVYYCARERMSGYGVGSEDYWGKGTQVTVTSVTPVPPTVFPLMQCGSVAGDMVTLGCLATGFKPLPLTFAWSKDGADLSDFLQYPSVEKDNLYTGVSQIRVRQADWDSSAKFRCVAKHSTKTVDAVITKTEGEGCPEADVDIQISGPTMEDIFLNKKGTVICQVKDCKLSVQSVLWEDQDGNEMAGTLKGTQENNLGTFETRLDITYDEWSRGIGRNCVVNHSKSAHPVKKSYKRTADFLVEMSHQWNNAVEAEQDNMGNTALTFIILFLITLLFSIGTTVFKVK